METLTHNFYQITRITNRLFHEKQTVNPTFQLDSQLQSIQEFMIQQEEKLGSGEDMKSLQGNYFQFLILSFARIKKKLIENNKNVSLFFPIQISRIKPFVHFYNA